MSMNLYARTKSNEKLDLWQTPTWISECCLYGHKGKRKWKDTRYLYLEWVKSNTKTTWRDIEDYENMKKNVKNEVERIMSAGKLKFYIM